MEIIKSKRYWIILGVISAFLLLFFGNINGNKNTYGDQLEISNLSTYTNGKPSDKDRLNFIKASLFKAVRLNNTEVLKTNSIEDILVRDGTFLQTDSDTGLHSVVFIVDIKSLKQSYLVSYQWSDESEHSDSLDEYGTQVTCLPVSDLIFGEFNCVDERIFEVGIENYDPVGKILPYEVKYKYRISNYLVMDGYVVLEVITPYDIVRPGESASILSKYRAEIDEWLAKNNLDPSKYRLELKSAMTEGLGPPL